MNLLLNHCNYIFLKKPLHGLSQLNLLKKLPEAALFWRELKGAQVTEPFVQIKTKNVLAGNRNRNLDNLEELSRGTAHPSDLVKDRTETTVLKAAYSATNHFLWYSH